MTRDEILKENRKGGGMFAVIPSVVMLDPELTASAKLLYGVITWRSGKYGFCWATNETLAEDVGLSAKRVSPLISQLEERGHIETEILLDKSVPGSKRRNIYPIVRSARGLVGGILKNEDTPILKNEETVSSKMRRQSPQKQGDSILKNEDIKKKNKIINNIPPIIPHEIAERIIEYCSDDNELQEALAGLLVNRAKVDRRKAVKTERALNGILRRLDELSAGRRDVKLALLDKATTNNWLTVYELKPDEMPAVRTESSAALPLGWGVS